MKAIIFEKYGGPEVLKVAELPKPKPEANEVQIRVKASTVTAGDRRMRMASPFTARIYNGLLSPRRVQILGFELAGVVAEAGPDVERLKAGDEVFAYCGFGFGGYAQYRCLPAAGKTGGTLVALKPKNATFEEAACLPLGGLAALVNLRMGGLTKGQHVLINGAAGSVGSYAVQIAKHRGAEITAVCSPKNFEFVRELGADHTIDYHVEDFIQGSKQYDLIYDAVGKLISGISKGQTSRVLEEGGTFVSVEDKRKDRLEDMDELRELVDAGALKAIVDRTYPMEEIIEAHRYADSGAKRGNIAIQIA